LGPQQGKHRDAFFDGFIGVVVQRIRVFFSFDLEAALVDARQLDDRQKVAALLEDVDWRERSLTRRLLLQPIAGQTGVERPLQIEQCLEGINESRDHARTPLR